MAETRAQNHGKVLSDHSQNRDELNPTHIGHGEIRNDEIEAFRGIAKEIQRFFRAGAHVDCIAEPFKDVLAHLSQHGLVIDKEDGSFASRAALITLERCLSGRRGVGQIDGECGAGAGGAVNGESAVIRGHDPVDNRQSQVRSFCGGLGGKKGVKNAVENLGRNPVTIVLHPQPDVGAGLCGSMLSREGVIHLVGSDCDVDPPVGTEGVGGIGAEIHQNLMHTGRVGQNGADIGGNLVANLDRLGQRGSQEANAFGHERRIVQWLGDRGGGATIAQRLPDNLPRPLSCGIHLLQVAPGWAVLW